MKKYYLIRKLTIIYRDGQFSNYKLVYLTGEVEGCKLSKIIIFPFDRELPNATFLDQMTLKEGEDEKLTIF